MERSVKRFSEYLKESTQFPHEIKSEKYWRHIIGNDQYAHQVLDTIMFKQRGFASDRQYALLKRLERGDTTPYHPKN